MLRLSTLFGYAAGPLLCAWGSLLKANRESCDSLSGLEREAVELLEPVEYEGYVGMAGRFVG